MPLHREAWGNSIPKIFYYPLPVFHPKIISNVLKLTQIWQFQHQMAFFLRASRAFFTYHPKNCSFPSNFDVGAATDNFTFTKAKLLTRQHTCISIETLVVCAPGYFFFLFKQERLKRIELMYCHLPFQSRISSTNKYWIYHSQSFLSCLDRSASVLYLSSVTSSMQTKT